MAVRSITNSLEVLHEGTHRLRGFKTTSFSQVAADQFPQIFFFKITSVLAVRPEGAKEEISGATDTPWDKHLRSDHQVLGFS